MMPRTRCSQCKYCVVDESASMSTYVQNEWKYWTAYMCSNRESEYYHALLNISKYGNPYDCIMWEGCENGERRDGWSLPEHKSIKRMPPPPKSKKSNKPRVKDGLYLCCACGQYKPRHEYYKDRRTKHGIQSSCKDCSSVRRQQLYAQKREMRRAMNDGQGNQG